MEILCPDAWRLNFTNPSGMAIEAILKHTSIKAVGLCNVPVVMQKGIAKLLNVAEQELVVQLAGLNRFVWVRQILHNSQSRLQKVIEEVASGNDPLVPENIPPFAWQSELIRHMGMIPCPYLHYYYTSHIFPKIRPFFTSAR